MVHAAYAIVLLPLAGFLVLLVLGRRLGDPLAGWVGTSAIGLAFVAALVTWAGLLGHPGGARSLVEPGFTWIPVAGLRVNAALLLDPLSMTMALFVTGVAGLIHMYSIGYMHEDGQYSKFFVYLNLFVFSMLLLVMSDNLVLTFVGWEGVGVCSYWLISFWFTRSSAATGGTKAFIYNRIGDFGFLVAMFLLFAKTGTLNYLGIFSAAHSGHISGELATAASLLLFLGAVGKSAQLPLYPWLLDAMEGPTPVSALIHAATMVTAGVYLMVRMSPLLALSTSAEMVVAVIGAVTAFVAAAAACAQSDIKKVLAFSTVSQLGYMFLAVGARAYVAAIFLMVTHAFYKALLFLGAGSVIHGLHEEQDLRKMGGLQRLMPITAFTFIVAWLAIAGVPPFAGFWSKGDVLLNAWAKTWWLWAIGLSAAVMTAYYMGRETVLTFFGPQRWREATPPGPSAQRHRPLAGESVGDAGALHGGAPHEPPRVMWVPLVVLAVLAFSGGVMNLPFLHFDWLDRWLTPVVAGGALRHLHLSGGATVGLEIADAVVAVTGAGLAVAIWGRRWQNPALEPRILRLGWGLDILYDATIGRPGAALAAFAATTFDRSTIDGAVEGAGRLVRITASRLRHVQTGYVRNYALGVALGAVLLLGWALSRASL
ncbi:MAG: NADH-quinone oxidoreductase subunit L [Acidimicrobiales bacterium]